jgi:hypothetical protein
MAKYTGHTSGSMNVHPTDYDQFQKFGHPGKYSALKIVNNGTGSFTGSDYGAGALIVGESSATGHADLSGGGRVNLAHLTVGTQYDFSLTEVACNAKTVYVLKRNPKIT